MVNCAKTVPDSTKLCLIKGPKSKFPWGSMPPDPSSLPHALHTNMCLPPPIIHTISFWPPLSKKLKETLLCEAEVKWKTSCHRGSNLQPSVLYHWAMATGQNCNPLSTLLPRYCIILPHYLHWNCKIYLTLWELFSLLNTNLIMSMFVPVLQHSSVTSCSCLLSDMEVRVYLPKVTCSWIMLKGSVCVMVSGRRGQPPWAVMLQCSIIGASVSEPHTSESNWDFSYIYIFSGVRRSVYSECCNLTR